MLDKTLLRKRFEKGFVTYRKNAFIQSKTAQLIIEIILKSNKNFKAIYEIGAGEGLLTETIDENLSYDTFYANDIVKSAGDLIKNINNNIIFHPGDIEKLTLPQGLDLVVSNAVLQWVEDLDSLFKKIKDNLNEGGMFIFSSFGEKNLIELKQITSTGLKYKELNELKSIFSNYFDIFYFDDYIEKLYFDKPFDVLNHLKFTGTNAIIRTHWTKTKLKDFIAKYEELREQSGIPVTYHPVIIGGIAK